MASSFDDRLLLTSHFLTKKSISLFPFLDWRRVKLWTSYVIVLVYILNVIEGCDSMCVLIRKLGTSRIEVSILHLPIGQNYFDLFFIT